jgi:hypothetical protein
MTLPKATEFYTEWFSVCPTQPQNFAPSPYLKALSNKITLQMKLVNMSMIF